MALHPKDRQAKLQQLESLFRDRGIPFTVQRRIIFEAVMDGPDHPTADDVYSSVHRRLPNLSRATVYRVLKTLVDLGMICKPSHQGAVRRYDIGTHRHHHLVCTRCEQAIDLDDASLDKLRFPDTRRSGFQIDDYSVHFSGVCRDCRGHQKPTKRKKKN